eukprot:g75994.t1
MEHAVWDLPPHTLQAAFATITCGDLRYELPKGGRDAAVQGGMSPVSLARQQSEPACGTCGVTFPDLPQLRAHFKSSWHLANLRLLARNADATALTEQQHDELAGEEDDEQDEEEQEEQEEEEDEAGLEDAGEAGEEQTKQQTKQHGAPHVLFHAPDGAVLRVWRVLLAPTRSARLAGYTAWADGLAQLALLPHTAAVFLCSGGRLAGALFERGRCVLHKTQTRYTTRRKQGGSQSTADNRGGSAPKSVGSSLRREQAIKFHQDVVGLLLQWRVQLRAASFIFLHAPAASSQCFFTAPPGGASSAVGKEATAAGGWAQVLLSRKDPRLRSIPFSVRRPTLQEAERVHALLFTVGLTQPAPPAATAHQNGHHHQPTADAAHPTADRNQLATAEPTSPTARQDAQATAGSSKSRSQEEGEEEAGEGSEQQEEQEDRVVACVERNDLAGLETLLESDYQRPLWSVQSVSVVLLAVLLRRPLDMLTALLEAGESADLRALWRFGPGQSNSTALQTKNKKNKKNKNKGGEAERKDSAAGSDAQTGPCYAAKGPGRPELQDKKAEQSSAVCWRNMNPLKRTALHWACAEGWEEACLLLLEEGWADPCLRDRAGRSPFQLVQGKALRNAIRRYAGENLEQCRWDRADVSPLTAKVEQEAKAKEAAKKRDKRQREKLRAKEKKVEQARLAEKEMVWQQQEAARQAELAEQAKVKQAMAARDQAMAEAFMSRERNQSALSDRERRARAAELRLLAVKGEAKRCDWCAKPLTKEPFHLLTFSYCSVDCVGQHKHVLQR